MRGRQWLWLAMLAVASVARADDDIDADRPDLANGPRPLALHHVQFEAGWTRYGNTDAPLDVFGEGLVRLGLARRLELRAIVPSWNRLRVESAAGVRRTTGLGDLGAGLKLGFTNTDARAIGLVLDATVPSGERPFRADDPTLDATLAVEVSRGPRSLTFNAGLSIEGSTTEAVGVFNAEFDLDHGVSAYGEIAEQGDFEGFDTTLDTGVTWKLTHETQIDGRIGVTTGGGSATFSGFGIAHRW